MTVVVGAAVLLLAGLGTWRLWTLEHRIADLRTRSRESHVLVETQLDELWQQVEQRRQEHAEWIQTRLRRADATTTQLTKEHGGLHQRLVAVEAWVRLWARASGSHQR